MPLKKIRNYVGPEYICPKCNSVNSCKVFSELVNKDGSFSIDWLSYKCSCGFEISIYIKHDEDNLLPTYPGTKIIDISKLDLKTI